MELVKTVFIAIEQEQQKAARYPNRKADHIDQAVTFVFQKEA